MGDPDTLEDIVVFPSMVRHTHMCKHVLLLRFTLHHMFIVGVSFRLFLYNCVPYRITELNYLDILRYAMNPPMTVLANARPATLLALASFAVVMAICAPLRHCASSCPHPAHSLPTLRLPCRPCSLGQRTLSPPLFPCLETECVATAALQGSPTSVSGDLVGLVGLVIFRVTAMWQYKALSSCRTSAVTYTRCPSTRCCAKVNS